jgi:hypothetical protein
VTTVLFQFQGLDRNSPFNAFVGSSRAVFGTTDNSGSSSGNLVVPPQSTTGTISVFIATHDRCAQAPFTVLPPSRTGQ